jgi:hypothetical protein
MFANGIGILTIGVEAHNISYPHAFWIAQDLLVKAHIVV